MSKVASNVDVINNSGDLINDLRTIHNKTASTINKIMAMTAACFNEPSNSQRDIHMGTLEHSEQEETFPSS